MRFNELQYQALTFDIFEDRGTIEKTLKNAGYNELGSGADSTVWTKTTGIVIKIIVPDDDRDISPSARTFKKFYEFCMQHQDLDCLPKFVKIQGQHYTEFTLNGKQYIQIAMEHLIPLQRDSFEEAMVWILSDLATEKLSWNNAIKEIIDINNWKYFEGLSGSEAIKNFKNLDKSKLLELEILYKLMTLLYHQGKINKLNWDLHTENVMKRQDGTLVIIDPWFVVNEGS